MKERRNRSRQSLQEEMKSKKWTRRFGLWFIYLHVVGNDQVLPVYLVVIFLSNEIAQRGQNNVLETCRDLIGQWLVC